MSKVLEKVERRLGERLFLKGERCIGPKCAMVRRAYPPGAHGKSRRRGRNASEYGEILREKQKLRYFYGLDDADIRRYVEEASGGRGLFSAHFIGLLERRLDSVVWRLGFASSRRSARQAINHGHITVNRRAVAAPSYRTKIGDIVGLQERMLHGGGAADLDQRLQALQPPPWLSLDKQLRIGTVLTLPQSAEEVGVTFNLTKIKELYSR